MEQTVEKKDAELSRVRLQLLKYEAAP